MWVISTEQGEIQFKERSEVRRWLRWGKLRSDAKAWNSLYNEWTTVAAIVRGQSPDDWENSSRYKQSKVPRPVQSSPAPTRSQPRSQTPPSSGKTYSPRPVPERAETKPIFFFHPIFVLFLLVTASPLGLLLLWIRPQRDFLGHPLARIALTLVFLVPTLKVCQGMF